MENVREVAPNHLANVVRAKTDQVLVIDSRTFCEYNTSHVIAAVNVWSSKIRKKRLQQNSMSVQDYLSSACEVRRSSEFGAQWSEIIVYDQSAPSLAAVPSDSFLYVLLDKLASAYRHVQLLVGGFLEFHAQYPDCCEDATQKCSPLTSLSQPCLPVANIGPTRILPFLYLGSQHDANNKQMLQDHCILYELNVSISCPKPDFVQDSHFFRIPVNDNFSEKLTPYFFDAFRFIDKVRESGGSVLVHCLAGISRSATVAIAYVMKHLHLPYEEAYRYVKNRRPTISPNINFVGQLLELDRLLRTDGVLCDPSSAPASFRQPCGNVTASPYGSTITNITNPSSYSSFSLDYSINNNNNNSRSSIGGVLSDVTSSSSSYMLSGGGGSALQRSDKLSNVSAGDGWLASSRAHVAPCSSRKGPPRDQHKTSNCSVLASPGCCSKPTGGNISCTMITQDEGSFKAVKPLGFPGALPRCPSDSVACKALREEARLAGFPKSPVGGVSRSLSLNLKSTLEAVPGSPGSTPQSPESAGCFLKQNLIPSPSAMTPNSFLTPESMDRSTVPPSPSSLSSLSSPMSCACSPSVGMSRLSFSQKTCPSPTSASCLRSPTIIEVRKSPTIMENIFDCQYSAMNSSNENLKNCQKNFYSSTATISVSGSNNNTFSADPNSNEDGSRPRSVCIIEVNTEAPVTYVENCSSEPMIVRETEVIATPSSKAELDNFRAAAAAAAASSAADTSNNNNNSSASCSSVPNLIKFSPGISSVDEVDGRPNPLPRNRTLVPIRASSSFGSIVDRPKVLELCTPVYTRRQTSMSGTGEGNGMIMGDCTWQNRPSTDHEPGDEDSIIGSTNLRSDIKANRHTDSTKGNNNDDDVLMCESETLSVTGSSEYNDTTSEFSVMQSDSGVSFQTEQFREMTGRAIPRCYSSSETHLNTRRLLENSASGDYATRKSCSNDEVAKSWSLHRPVTTMTSNPMTSGRDHTSDDQLAGGGIPWHYPGELVRCDSWSTSGLGSELSDWESLQEDANSTHCDDALGPFDAVFSDVFPGEKSDSLSSASQLYRRVFPPKLVGEDPSEETPGVGGQKARHHSFKEHRGGWRQQQLSGAGKILPLARPASLPGVMGSYLAQHTGSEDECGSDAVELRPVSGRGRGLQRSSGSRDSGTSGCAPLLTSDVPSEGATGVRRNDSGYYSVSDQPLGNAKDMTPAAAAPACRDAPAGSPGKQGRQQPPSKLLLKPLHPPHGRPVPYRPPRSAGRSGTPSSPPKLPSSPPKPTARRQTSPTKSPSPTKSSPQGPTSPTRKASSPPKTPASPQPRTFGASTFYLPGDTKDSSSPTGKNPTADSLASKPAARQVSLSRSKNFVAPPPPKTSMTSPAVGSTSVVYTSSGDSAHTATVSQRNQSVVCSISGNVSSKSNRTIYTSKSVPVFAAGKPGFRGRLDPVLGRAPKSLSPVLSCSVSPENGSPSRNSESPSGSGSLLDNSSSSSSRETSIESEASIVQIKGISEPSAEAAKSLGATDTSKNTREDTPSSGSSSPCAAAERDKIPSPHCSGLCADERPAETDKKKKHRCGFEETKTKEKRRSCELDSSSSDEQHKKSVSLMSGVRLAQELLQSMESVVTSELSEIRRCTAELSSRYGLKTRPRGDPLPLGPKGPGVRGPSYIYARKVKNTSQFYVVADPPTGALQEARCRSEPPFGTEEGLYRAQSCPGLPQPLLERSEDQESVGELRSPPVAPLMLRTQRHPPSKEKLLNRYSCGALDSTKAPPVSLSGDMAFESCPDLGALRPTRPCTSDSSSSSVSSSRSSFSRLLQVS